MQCRVRVVEQLGTLHALGLILDHPGQPGSAAQAAAVASSRRRACIAV